MNRFGVAERVLGLRWKCDSPWSHREVDLPVQCMRPADKKAKDEP